MGNAFELWKQVEERPMVDIMVQFLSETRVDSSLLVQTSIDPQKPEPFIANQEGNLVEGFFVNNQGDERKAVSVEEGKGLDKQEHRSQKEVLGYDKIVFDVGKLVCSLLVHVEDEGVMNVGEDERD